MLCSQFTLSGLCFYEQSLQRLLLPHCPTLLSHYCSVLVIVILWEKDDEDDDENVYSYCILKVIIHQR